MEQREGTREGGRVRGRPEAVFWRSKDDELAPIDIISVDEGGDRIYIEVKATSASNPATPFDISRFELLEAGAHRDLYYIYRVTDTVHAVVGTRPRR